MIRALCATALILGFATAFIGEQRINVNVDLVDIHFTVCNKKGRPIGNLSREDFSVFEDDSRQAITNFSRETDLPLTMALLIDTSGSVRFKLSFERAAATEFLHSTLRPGSDKAAVFAFDSVVELLADYTDDVHSLTGAVGKTHSGGGTRLYDALYFVLSGTFGAREGRRGIILLTDGDDNSSRVSPQEVVEAAQRRNVAIYAISVNAIEAPPLRDPKHSDGILEMFASETGGRAFFPKDAKQLSSYFQAISNELRTQYSIAYRSTNAKRDGTFRKIRIDAREGHYLVRSRAGYYAPATQTGDAAP
jgi:VWFA-related protein